MKRLLATAAAIVTAAALQMSVASAPAFAAPGQTTGLKGLSTSPGVSQSVEVGRRFGGGGRGFGMRSFGGGKSFGRSFGGKSFGHRRFGGFRGGNFNRHAFRGGKHWGGGRFHRHRRFWYGSAFAAVPYYYYNDYGYGSCYYLKRRAIRTGSPYWWRRYEDCKYGYGY